LAPCEDFSRQLGTFCDVLPQKPAPVLELSPNGMLDCSAIEGPAIDSVAHRSCRDQFLACRLRSFTAASMSPMAADQPSVFGDVVRCGVRIRRAVPSLRSLSCSATTFAVAKRHARS